jgi:hypothetical protein
MGQIRRTVSLSTELHDAVSLLAADRGESFSAVVEMALRENPLVRDSVELVRMEAKIEDYGIRPGKDTPFRSRVLENLKAASASGESPPKPRRRGAVRP